ncbi:MAG: histidine phosphatase family protein [Kordia sp.]|nr:MAG: histidine phosphatase family protein [Kordia sp.]
MKRIYLIRHAKSSWKHQVSDLKRPLKKRGFNDAELVGKHTNTLFNPPDVILCSPSKRTSQTAIIFIQKWKLESINITFINELYDFSGENLIKMIKNYNNELNSIMIFAHNFAVTEFVNIFGTTAIDSVPTCGFVVIDFDIDSWKNLTKGKTVYKVFPKELK